MVYIIQLAIAVHKLCDYKNVLVIKENVAIIQTRVV